MGEPFINGFNNVGDAAIKYNLSLEQNVHSGAVLGTPEEIYTHYSFCIMKGK